MQLTVSVSSPGLPMTLQNEAYECHFHNKEMGLSFVVPTEEITANTEYTCNINGQVPTFSGIKAGNTFFMECLAVQLNNACMHYQNR